MTQTTTHKETNSQDKSNESVKQEKRGHKLSITAAQRRMRVLEMRKAGINFQAISENVKVSRSQVIRDFKRALDEVACGRVLTMQSERSLELQRLEIAMLAIIPKVRQGELPAIDRWLRLCESRRRLLGLNMKSAKSLKSAKARREALKTYVGLDLEKV